MPVFSLLLGSKQAQGVTPGQILHARLQLRIGLQRKQPPRRFRRQTVAQLRHELVENTGRFHRLHCDTIPRAATRMKGCRGPGGPRNDAAVCGRWSGSHGSESQMLRHTQPPSTSRGPRQAARFPASRDRAGVGRPWGRSYGLQFPVFRFFLVIFCFFRCRPGIPQTAWSNGTDCAAEWLTRSCSRRCRCR